MLQQNDSGKKKEMHNDLKKSINVNHSLGESFIILLDLVVPLPIEKAISKEKKSAIEKSFGLIVLISHTFSVQLLF